LLEEFLDAKKLRWEENCHKVGGKDVERKHFNCRG
jgi:hypothetical protein